MWKRAGEHRLSSSANCIGGQKPIAPAARSRMLRALVVSVCPQQGEQRWDPLPTALSCQQQHMERENPPWEAPACAIAVAVSERCREVFPSAHAGPARQRDGAAASGRLGAPPLSLSTA